MRKLFSVLLSMVLFLVNFSCNNDHGEATSHLRITLIDQAADYESVNIDIREVRVHTSALVSDDGDDDMDQNDDQDNDTDENGGWVTLEGSDFGEVNILDYVAGNELTIYDSEFPAGYVSQIRLVLGDENTVVINGDSLKLTTPSGQESGVKLNVNKNLEAGLSYILKLDFEASRSVIHTGSDKYMLKPVIRVITEDNGGSIKGEVLPADATVEVLVKQGEDVIGSTFAKEGVSGFLVSGVDAGTYQVALEPVDDPDSETVLMGKLVEDVVVEDGKVTDIGIYDLETE